MRKLTFGNKVSRIVVLELLVAEAEASVTRLHAAHEHWESSDGPVASQVCEHVRRERNRQIMRLEALRIEYENLKKLVPAGWKCGIRDPATAWNCQLHVGHEGDHYYPDKAP